MINPGQLTDRLAVKMPQKRSSAFGISAATDFTPYNEGRAVPAHRIRVSGSEVRQNGELFNGQKADYEVRYHHDIREKWRVTDLDTGTEYSVKSVDPYPNSGRRVLHCEKVDK